MSRRPNPAVLAFVLLSLLSSAFAGEVRLTDTETPAFLEFGQSHYTVSSGDSNAIVTVIRTGDFRIPASAEFVAREKTGGGSTPASGVIRFPAGRSFLELSIPIGTPTRPGEEKIIEVLMSNPAPRTMILRASCQIIATAVSAAGTAASPRLAMRRQGTSRLTLSWPASASNFTLEKCAHLKGGEWTEVRTPPATLGGEFVVEEQATESAQCFYRLSHRPQNDTRSVTHK